MMGRKPKRTKRYKIAKDRYISPQVRRKVRERDDNRCVICNRANGTIYLNRFKPYKVKLEFGHVFPHSKGGDRCINNIQMECKKCNRKKGAKYQKNSRWAKMNKRGARGCKKHNQKK